MLGIITLNPKHLASYEILSRTLHNRDLHSQMESLFIQYLHDKALCLHLCSPMAPLPNLYQYVKLEDTQRTLTRLLVSFLF